MSTTGNTRRHGVSPLSSTMFRRRIVWTVVLVLSALGGAGLATAADRLPTDASRPELTWRADRLVEPRIQTMAAQLSAINERVGRLAAAGRDTLGLLPDLDTDQIAAALASGDESAALLLDQVELLLDMRAEQFELINEERLSQGSRDRIAAIDEALSAVDPLPGTWSEMAADARVVTVLLDALVRHDGIVFRATTAGRQADWARALSLLDDAALALAEARSVRDQLAAETNVETLDELLARYADYDAALTALYAEIERSGTQEGPAIDALRAEVERTQAALPPNNDALRVVVADAAGPSVTAGLVEIERARGVVAEALTLLGTE